MLTHYEITLRLCVATCVHAQMIDKLMNWYKCKTPVSPIAATNMPHGVTCGYETQHHTPGMTLTSMSPRIKSENRRMCGVEQNWRFIDNYTSPPGMSLLRLYSQGKQASNKNMFRLLRSLDGQRVQHQPEFRVAAQECELSLSVLMCLIEQRTQRSQRFVVLLRKRACWILCLQISSLTTSPVLCRPSHGSQMLPWTRE